MSNIEETRENLSTTNNGSLKFRNSIIFNYKAPMFDIHLIDCILYQPLGSSVGLAEQFHVVHR